LTIKNRNQSKLNKSYNQSTYVRTEYAYTT